MISELTADQMYPGRAIVDLDAIADNLQVLRRYAPSAAQMAIVKANAYGHGLVPVSLAALRGGASMLGVAQAAEALQLRAGLDQAGIPRADAPILAWVAASGANWARLLEADIDVSISWTWVLAEVCAAARTLGTVARIHVKVDTGMSRAGSTLADFPALVAALRTARDEGLIDIVGAWTHLSRGDDLSADGRACTAAQVEAFEEALRMMADAGISPKIRHMAATSGILWHPETHYDMVRVGIGMYGLSPDPAVATGESFALRPAMALIAPLTSVKVVEASTPVSYGGTWNAPTRRWLGLVPLGYADGILRACSNAAPVLVNAEEPMTTHVVGRICMDQFAIDLGPADGDAGTPSTRSGCAPARVGDAVTLFGNPSTGEPSVDTWAACGGTINYEVLSRLGERIPRSYLSRNIEVPQ